MHYETVKAGGHRMHMLLDDNPYNNPIKFNAIDAMRTVAYATRQPNPDDKIMLIVGESGSGKDTIQNYLAENGGFKKLVSYTTRPRRESDAEDAHIFITDAEYDKLNNIVAATIYHGYRYCATQELVDDAHLYIIDPPGIDYFKRAYKGKKKAICVYIKTGIFTRLNRLRKRDGWAFAFKRVINDLIAFHGVQRKCDWIVSNNGRLSDACAALWTMLMYK
jgi:guanylate kinase